MASYGLITDSTGATANETLTISGNAVTPNAVSYRAGYVSVTTGLTVNGPATAPPAESPYNLEIACDGTNRSVTFAGSYAVPQSATVYTAGVVSLVLSKRSKFTFIYNKNAGKYDLAGDPLVF